MNAYSNRINKIIAHKNKMEEMNYEQRRTIGAAKDELTFIKKAGLAKAQGIDFWMDRYIKQC